MIEIIDWDWGRYERTEESISNGKLPIKNPISVKGLISERNSVSLTIWVISLIRFISLLLNIEPLTNQQFLLYVNGERLTLVNNG